MSWDLNFSINCLCTSPRASRGSFGHTSFFMSLICTLMCRSPWHGCVTFLHYKVWSLNRTQLVQPFRQNWERVILLIVSPGINFCLEREASLWHFSKVPDTSSCAYGTPAFASCLGTPDWSALGPERWAGIQQCDLWGTPNPRLLIRKDVLNIPSYKDDINDKEKQLFPFSFCSSPLWQIFFFPWCYWLKMFPLV